MEHLPYIACPLNAWAPPRFNAWLILTNLPSTLERIPKSDSCCDLKDCVCQVLLFQSFWKESSRAAVRSPSVPASSDFCFFLTRPPFPPLPDWKGGNYPRLICSSHSLTAWLPQVVSCHPFYLEWNPEGIKVGNMNRRVSAICGTTSGGFKWV